MNHRHLNHQRTTLAALDDIILRGDWQDWRELRAQALARPELLHKLIKICAAHSGEPSAQRHHFWMSYAKAHLNDEFVSA